MSKDQRAPKHLLRPKTPLAPPRHAGRIISVQSESNVNDVINNALGIIKQQVDTLGAKSRMGGSLQDQDVKNLRIYIQSLVELSREDRERTKHDGIEDWLAALSTDELIKMAQGQLATSATLDSAIDTTATPQIINESSDKAQND